ncbi:MAG: VWA domain-containing protein [Candidatus Omnitrophota bacterium]
MTFANPLVLALVFLIPPLLFLTKRFRSKPAFSFSYSALVNVLKPTFRERMSSNLIVLRACALALIIIALARPRLIIEEFKTYTEGVDIVLALDTSTSMLAEDFTAGGRRVNRFEITREVVKNFIEKRKNDRLGIIAFAAHPYTVCPLTFDHSWLLENLDRVSVGMLEDATAIGSAVAASLTRLKDSAAKSRIIILVTDGVNNAGEITASTAAEAAKALKIKVYTVGVGSKGAVPYPFRDRLGRTVYRNVDIDLDEATLKRIAELTGGRYYRAADARTMKTIYDEIDKLEKTKIENTGYKEYREFFPYFLVPGLITLLLEILLANTVLMRIP